MGHIRKRGPGRWQARYRGPDGRERARTFARKGDAQRYLSTVEADKLRGLWLDPALGKTRFSEWAERWMATNVHLKPKSRHGYESLLRCHVVPRFGDIPLARIDRLMVRQWVADLDASGLSPARIRQAHRVLSMALASAVESGVLAKNPASGVKLPRVLPAEAIFLTAAQVEALADAIDEPYRVLVFILAYGGLRWGEVAALRRHRVDLNRSHIRVVASLAEVGGVNHFGSTKTYDRRTVVLPAFVRRELAEHLILRGPSDPRGLVFLSARGRPLRHSNFRRRVWLPAVRAAGVPDAVRMHDLRHTCASLLIAEGAHPKVIQEHLGHSSIIVTMDTYGHLYPSAMEKWAVRLNEMRTAVVRGLPAPERLDTATTVALALRKDPWPFT
ncbi:MAG: site-specific integrase [Actinomycetota bacterium]|nr:site-specific integrase [Actinomycetota bacterium]